MPPMPQFPDPNPPEEKKPESLKHEVLDRTSTLATGALGLIAALAWNDAVISLFTKIFGTQSNGIIAKFAYAVFVTGIVVFLSIRLQRAVKKL